MFFERGRLEVDLERIRQANLSEDKRLQEEADEKELLKEIREKSAGVGFKDVLAMTIAIISLILPYLIVTLVVCGAVLWYFVR
ncbi:MAG: hypothetical protein ACOX6O_04170 [Christensenellales bacterium]|jgi:hypothetical protein